MNHSELLKNESYQREIEELAKNLYINVGTNTNVLITGGTGTIGTELVDGLMKANELYNANINIFIQTRNSEKAEEKFIDYTDSNNFTIVEKDVRDGIKTDVDYGTIFHLASNADPKTYDEKPIETRETILNGTKAVVDYAVENPDCRVMFASTMEVYGRQSGDKGLDIKETAELGVGLSYDNQRDKAYPLSKIEAENMCRDGVEKGANITIGRIPYTYGNTHEKGNSLFVNQCLDNAIDGNQIEVKSSVAGLINRKFENTADVLRYMSYALNGAPGESYNLVSTDKSCSLLDFAKMCGEAAGQEIIKAPQDAYTTNPLVHNCLNGEKINELVNEINNYCGIETSRIYNSNEEAINNYVDMGKEIEMKNSLSL